MYNSLINVTQTVNIKSPTMTQYLQLYSIYPQTLTCPCTQISISYGAFLDVQYTFHQVCSSFFITEDWFAYLSTTYQIGNVSTGDFRLRSPSIFQALNAFCGLINETISNRLAQFDSSQYVSAFVVPSQVLDTQAQSSISEFISSTTNDFLLSLSIIRNTTQSNALSTGPITNVGFRTASSTGYVTFFFWTYDGCNCMLSPTCASPAVICDYACASALFIVPGFFCGCFTIESLLQSDLRCFYNQTCIDEMQSYFISSSPMNVTALDESLPSRFLPNSTLQNVVDELMVEEWTRSIMYENYFNECQPTECTYTHETKNSIIYIVTTLFGLTGGLTTALKLLVPRLVNFIASRIRTLRMRSAVVMPMVET
jgi:hypothetical protein